MKYVLAAAISLVVLIIIFFLVLKRMKVGEMRFQKEDGIPYKWIIALNSDVGIFSDLPKRKWVILRIREENTSLYGPDSYSKEGGKNNE